jgi:hypothetical protein
MDDIRRREATVFAVLLELGEGRQSPEILATLLKADLNNDYWQIVACHWFHL